MSVSRWAEPDPCIRASIRRKREHLQDHVGSRGRLLQSAGSSAWKSGESLARPPHRLLNGGSRGPGHGIGADPPHGPQRPRQVFPDSGVARGRGLLRLKRELAQGTSLSRSTVSGYSRHDERFDNPGIQRRIDASKRGPPPSTKVRRFGMAPERAQGQSAVSAAKRTWT